MKWQVIDGNLEANSRYHDDGVPFRWWIEERDNAFWLYSTSELWDTYQWGDMPKSFDSVIEVILFADDAEAVPEAEGP